MGKVIIKDIKIIFKSPKKEDYEIAMIKGEHGESGFEKKNGYLYVTNYNNVDLYFGVVKEKSTKNSFYTVSELTTGFKVWTYSVSDIRNKKLFFPDKTIKEADLACLYAAGNIYGIDKPINEFIKDKQNYLINNPVFGRRANKELTDKLSWL